MRRPLIPATLGLVSGILISYYFNNGIYFIILFMSFIGYLVIAYINNFHSSIIRFLFLLFTLTGFFLGYFHLHYLPTNSIYYCLKTDVEPGWMWLQGRLISERIEAFEKIRLYLDLQAISDDAGKHWKSCSGMVRLNSYQRNPDIEDKLLTNTVVQLPARLYLPTSQKNPESFDYPFYLFCENILALGTLGDLDSIKVISNSNYSIFTYLSSIRINFNKLVINKATKQWPFTSDAAALIISLLTGNRSYLTLDLKRKFRLSGLFHILAISGLHLGILCTLCFVILRILNINKLVSSFFTLVVIFSFWIFIGERSATTRAAIIIIVYCAGIVIGRKQDLLNCLAFAAFLILLTDPLAIFNVGFQLTFSATLGICFLVKPIYLSLPSIRFRWLRISIAVALSATLSTFPILGFAFGRVPLLAFISGLVVIPALWLIMLLGLFAILFTILNLISIADILISNCYYLSQYIITVIDELSSVLGNTIPTKPFPFWLLIIYYLGLTTLIPNFWYYLITSFKVSTKNQVHLSSFKRFLKYISLLLTLSFLTWPRLQLDLPRPLRCTFLDVGQGDASIVQLPNGENLVIDAGYSSKTYDVGEFIVEPYLRKLGIFHIDYLVMTSTDRDHSGGIFSLLSQFNVCQFFSTSVTKPTLYIDKIVRKLNHLKYKTKSHYNDFNLPYQLSTNNKSAVLEVTYGDLSFLFTADIGIEVEKILLNQCNLKEKTILKIAHHGSKYSTCMNFLDKIKPKIAIISVGAKNHFGHPSNEVLYRLKQCVSHPKIFRTDQNGAIIIESDGNNVTLFTMMDEN